ncbi:MAG: hypothetical protein V5B33_16860 [Candidatus Accumulibacter sp. UW20]|jgi:hypothetical protein
MHMQVTATGELAAVEDNKTLIGDVKNDRLSFGVIRILNELQGHTSYPWSASR